MKSLAFLINPEHKLASSTLRGEQLYRICQTLFSKMGYSFSLCYDFRDLSNQIVFLTKPFLIWSHLAQFKIMRAAGNILVADWLDGQVRQEIIPELDAFISSSVSQTRFFKSEYGRIPCFHITHHVDTRIPEIMVPSDKLRIGYFGNPINAKYLSAIRSEIGIVSVSDANDLSWIAKLKDYNCHYAVRNYQSWDGFKPFTKGFIAAHCGAAIIVDRTDTEANAYLGEKYPFRVNAVSEEDIRSSIEKVHLAYGTETWRSALSTMETLRLDTSQQVIERELLALLQFDR